MDVKICDFCRQMVAPDKVRRVLLVEEEEATVELCIERCIPKYTAYRRAAQAIVERHENEMRRELADLKEEFLNAAEKK